MNSHGQDSRSLISEDSSQHYDNPELIFTQSSYISIPANDRLKSFIIPSDIANSLKQIHKELPFNLNGINVCQNINIFRASLQQENILSQLTQNNPQISQEALENSLLLKASTILAKRMKNLTIMISIISFIWQAIMMVGYISYFYKQNLSHRPNLAIVVPLITQMGCWCFVWIGIIVSAFKFSPKCYIPQLVFTSLLAIYSGALIVIGFITSQPYATQYMGILLSISSVAFLIIIMHIPIILQVNQAMRKLALLFKQFDGQK